MANENNEVQSILQFIPKNWSNQIEFSKKFPILQNQVRTKLNYLIQSKFKLTQFAFQTKSFNNKIFEYILLSKNASKEKKEQNEIFKSFHKIFS
jgi:hypothetical protein